MLRGEAPLAGRRPAKVRFIVFNYNLLYFSQFLFVFAQFWIWFRSSLVFYVYLLRFLYIRGAKPLGWGRKVTIRFRHTHNVHSVANFKMLYLGQFLAVLAQLW